ncbi:DNA polymerase III subunit delta [Bifidobacterium actinocoloniiforme DSM 22766]|uniref:DNA-directed DNA polymerase n=1 Tax=Bifidobacterium actinocoloniiforme DSM 22766 TaxID=1437605 RepID=A0A086Z0A9_9BIFI|nr:DNA polymerase III subunit delta [Bifidobacterium actinocoloniiforme]AKV55211.1 DNA polymerase III subunit delta [Bifidobacterium actinocoloniiforme DSM 22766]KFI39959.1 DNA polymerase III subunit delta [Bifidobacterium actinocoloniiforme DSM 22766]
MTQDQSAVWPFTILTGGDAFLADRAMRSLRDQAKAVRSQAEVVELDAGQCDAYAFDEAISPSLLSEAGVVLVNNLDDARDALGEAMVAFCAQAVKDPESDSVVICRHSGGNKGRRLLAALDKAGARKEQVPNLKRADDKLGFVLDEFKRRGRRLEPQAAQLLVSVLGDRTAELAAMCEQLCFDFDQDPLTLAVVQEYLTDDPQAGSFLIAELAMGGNGAQAIVAMREALRQGVDALAMIGALAFKVRLLAKVAALDAGKIDQSQVGAPPWQVRQVRRQLKSWTSSSLARAIEALAQADERRKGVGGDPGYAVERALRVVASKGKEA